MSAPQPPAPPVLRRRGYAPAKREPPVAPRTKPTPKLSDLDIQIAHSPKLTLAASRYSSPKYNVETRLRCGTVISNTVDSWARHSPFGENTYKPLVFGGTFPIDVPASPPDRPDNRALPDSTSENRESLKKHVERSIDSFEAIVAKRGKSLADRRRAFSKREIKTFDIDEPVQVAHPAGVPYADTRYAVSDPKTFNIDEPVSYL